MKENSKVLALKYRPTVFKDLIGQDVIRDTILSSIKDNKTPNAYLFTGIRGVGKTTTARLVAKALNCKNGIENIGNQDSEKSLVFLHSVKSIHKNFINKEVHRQVFHRQCNLSTRNLSTIVIYPQCNSSI